MNLLRIDNKKINSYELIKNIYYKNKFVISNDINIKKIKKSLEKN